MVSEWNVSRAARDAMDAAGNAKGAAHDAWVCAMSDNPAAPAEMRRQLERVEKHATNAATLARTILDRMVTEVADE